MSRYAHLHHKRRVPPMIVGAWTRDFSLSSGGTREIELPSDSGVTGFLMAGDDEEWALFRVNSSGTVSLVKYSANVVANAAAPGTDGKINIGVGTTSPLLLRNKLSGADRNFILTIWNGKGFWR